MLQKIEGTKLNLCMLFKRQRVPGEPLHFCREVQITLG